MSYGYHGSANVCSGTNYSYGSSIYSSSPYSSRYGNSTGSGSCYGSGHSGHGYGASSYGYSSSSPTVPYYGQVYGQSHGQTYGQSHGSTYGQSPRSSYTTTTHGSLNDLQTSPSRYNSFRYTFEPAGSCNASDASTSTGRCGRPDRPTAVAASATGISSSSTAATPLSRPYSASPAPSPADQNVDYKKLFEAERDQSELLKQDIRLVQDGLGECRRGIELARRRHDRLNPANHKGETGCERRERRGLERKISELEEEHKELTKLKSENDNLKDENRALTRVVTKLSK